MQPVQNKNVLLMQSSSGLINLMTFNMANTHHIEIPVTDKNHNSLGQLRRSVPEAPIPQFHGFWQ